MDTIDPSMPPHGDDHHVSDHHDDSAVELRVVSAELRVVSAEAEAAAAEAAQRAAAPTDGELPEDPAATGDLAEAAPSPDPVAAMVAAGLDARLARLLASVVAAGASDLHLSAGIPPMARIDGVLRAAMGEEKLTPAEIGRMVHSTLNTERWERYLAERQLDYSLTLGSAGRFRVNAYHQRSSPGAAFRVITDTVPTLDDLGVPPGVRRARQFPYGLVLFVGPTGSGKSTTQAALIAQLNRERPCHILTIEDPIEYLHPHQAAMVNQREVGHDVPSFGAGLRAALREDPDVILLGEMRDEESIAITLTLAETGHLVFATLHTNDAAQAIDRIVDSYPADRRAQIETQLAGALQAVVSQRLVRKKGGGRAAAFEVMIVTDAIRNLIREGKTRQIRNIIATSSAEGMQTLEASLDRLVAAGSVAYEEAIGVSQYWKEIRNPALAQAAALTNGAASVSGVPVPGAPNGGVPNSAAPAPPTPGSTAHVPVPTGAVAGDVTARPAGPGRR